MALEALRESVLRLVVVGRWDCCPSIDLAFNFDSPAVPEAGPPLIEAWHRSKPYQLLLFAPVDGDIRTLELVHYNDEVDELPPRGGRFGGRAEWAAGANCAPTLRDTLSRRVW